MQTLYPFFLTTHLLCAIVFLGFIFTDVVLLSILRRTLGDNALQNVMKRGTKIMPLRAFACADRRGDDDAVFGLWQRFGWLFRHALANFFEC